MRDVPTHVPPSQSPRPTAHQQERGPASSTRNSRWVLPPLFPSSAPFSLSLPFLLPSSHKSEYAERCLRCTGCRPEDRARIVDAICAAPIGFSNDAVQRCLEAATGPEERRQIVACMRGRIVDLTMHC
ncbi:hypothetical protein B0H14DRAFT_2995167, partial [Mycena olivaceomarginata]